MPDSLRTFTRGAAEVAVISVGALDVKLADWIPAPEREWPPHHAAAFRHPFPAPILDLHIRLPGMSILVDASVHDSPSGLALVDGLARIGVAPEEITHVVITHGHWDHFNAIVCEKNGVTTPRFPNARHYFGRADWELDRFQSARKDPDSLESRTLGVVDRAGLLEPVDGNRDLGNGVQILAAPGESPGHQIVKIQSEGQTLYAVGDLYHHEVEVERPDWMAHWADPTTNRASRDAFVPAALAEDALIVATHVFTIGRLQRTASGVAWANVP